MAAGNVLMMTCAREVAPVRKRQKSRIGPVAESGDTTPERVEPDVDHHRLVLRCARC
jgi:hypothetical protein